MSAIDVNIRFSGLNVKLDKLATLSLENNLVYQDEGGECAAHASTIKKFTILTLASPLIAIARVVRSVAFICIGHFNRSGREFVGGLASPLISGGCLLGSLFSSTIYCLSSGEISFYVQMRRTYAYFEAWINEIDLQSPDLVSYSERVSGPCDWVGDSTCDSKIHRNVWTTAPCMQPVLEKGKSSQGGLFDTKRMGKIFPSVKVNNVLNEDGKIVVQSEYLDKSTHHVACNGAVERARLSQTCCCCYRIDAAFDRILCCEVGQGKCSSMFNSNNSCEISFCTVCGVGVCCCQAQIDDLSS